MRSPRQTTKNVLNWPLLPLLLDRWRGRCRKISKLPERSHQSTPYLLPISHIHDSGTARKGHHGDREVLASVAGDRSARDDPDRGASRYVAQVMHVVMQPGHRDVGRKHVG